MITRIGHLLLLALFVGGTAFVATGCPEEESEGPGPVEDEEQMNGELEDLEDEAEDTGEDIEDEADDVGDDIEDEADDIEDDLDQ